MISNAIVWDVNPMLIDSFVKVRWYGLMFAIGFLVGYKIVDKMFKKEGVPADWIDKLHYAVSFSNLNCKYREFQ